MKLFVSAAVATVAIAGTGLTAGGAPPITAKVFGAATVQPRSTGAGRHVLGAAWIAAPITERSLR